MAAARLTSLARCRTPTYRWQMERPTEARQSTLAFTLRHRRSADRALQPTLPPIEDTARHLRRLRRMLETLPRGASMVRTVGIQRAYDQFLATACIQLDVATNLPELPDGTARIVERNRLEYLLGECGLRF